MISAEHYLLTIKFLHVDHHYGDVMTIPSITQESSEFEHSLQSRSLQLQWTKCADLPTAMHAAYATVINTTLYICGGVCPNDDDMANVYKYQLDKNQWRVLPPLQQYRGIPVDIDNQLTVIGGYHSTTYKPTVQVTTFTDNTWTITYPNLSVARAHPAVVPYHKYVIVAGGLVDDETALESIEVLDATMNHWMIVNTLLPKPMYDISATICTDSFTIVGYTDGADDKRYKETYIIPIDKLISQQQQTQQSLTSSSDKDNTKWHRLADAPYWKTALAPNTSPPVIIGGEDEQDNTVNNIIIHDDTKNRWKKIASLPINRAWTIVAVINDCIFVMGGASDTKTAKTTNATVLSDVNVGQLVLCD